jgi:hypothetical protein
LTKASEQFQQSDVTFWGLVALVCGAVAVLSANISAAMPPNVLAGLHKTRIEGASLEQMRLQMAELREDTARLQGENNTLLTRFSLQEHAGNEVVQRVGALEVSLPLIMESLDEDASVDRSAVTASIGGAGQTILEAEGGSVKVEQRPLEPVKAALDQPKPALVPDAPAPAIADANAFGVAVGPSVTDAQAGESWSDLANKLGPLLLGLSPLLADEANGNTRILVGPITELSQATALCARLERVSVSCMPMPFTGRPLSM